MAIAGHRDRADRRAVYRGYEPALSERRLQSGRIQPRPAQRAVLWQLGECGLAAAVVQWDLSGLRFPHTHTWIGRESWREQVQTTGIGQRGHEPCQEFPD